ncbi:hypothetical protein K1719_042464 [Acacia pycnantha]|nr:hypothetical protein K1719_042464 [Acacia pycnantha]
MAPLMKSLVLLLLIMVGAATLQRGKAIWILPPKTTVIIQNMLTQGQDLSFHCKSKNDDLGQRTIKGGQTWGFSFRPNSLVDSTLYHCQFWWPSHVSPHHFDIYREGRDWWCKVCAWAIYDSAPCIAGHCYPWASPSSSTPQALHLLLNNNNATAQ